jgi:hypothetical protein
MSNRGYLPGPHEGASAQTLPGLLRVWPYLLAGEATMINRAISDSIVAMCKSNPNGCLGGK